VSYKYKINCFLLFLRNAVAKYTCCCCYSALLYDVSFISYTEKQSHRWFSTSLSRRYPKHYPTNPVLFSVIMCAFLEIVLDFWTHFAPIFVHCLSGRKFTLSLSKAKSEFGNSNPWIFKSISGTYCLTCAKCWKRLVQEYKQLSVFDVDNM